MVGKLYFHIGEWEPIQGPMLAHALQQAATDPNYEADAHITIHDEDMFFRVLTVERVKLLRYVHQRVSVASVQALADELGRDHSSVAADAAVLLENGLLVRDDGSLTLYGPTMILTLYGPTMI